MHYPKLMPDSIFGVDVFLEKRLSRLFVGRLIQKKEEYLFTYASSYLKAKHVMPLGVEFPLTRASFTSEALFPSFQDRLPDPTNAAYPDYCAVAGISLTTKDPLILLATIGKRGPSSFIFEPVYRDTFTYQDYEDFRHSLGLSLQDFAHLFQVSVSALQKMKTGRSSGEEILKRLELYARFPEVLQYELQRNGKWLHTRKLAFLSSKISCSS